MISCLYDELPPALRAVEVKDGPVHWLLFVYPAYQWPSCIWMQCACRDYVARAQHLTESAKT